MNISLFWISEAELTRNMDDQTLSSQEEDNVDVRICVEGVAFYHPSGGRVPPILVGRWI